MSGTGDPALVGRTVAGKFVIEKFLGGGAMGAVYRARQLALEKDVALKVLHRSLQVDPSFAQRFQREAKVASRLDHPNLLRVIDYGEEPDGLLYIAMEYLEGRDLCQVMQEDWPLPAERIADIVMQALAAMAAAHELGVVHRDLKPENIMVLRGKDDEGKDVDTVKVCDFGIAKLTEGETLRASAPPEDKLTVAGSIVGTPEYMSPEQGSGQPLDPRSDIYSMGIILYQLITGRVPFTSDSPIATVLKHISENPEPPRSIYPGVDPTLEAIAMRALSKSRDDRFQNAREMRTALRSVADVPISQPELPSLVEIRVSAPGKPASGASAATAESRARVAREEEAEARRSGGFPWGTLLFLLLLGAGLYVGFSTGALGAWARGLAEKLVEGPKTTPSTRTSSVPATTASSEPAPAVADAAPLAEPPPLVPVVPPMQDAASPVASDDEDEDADDLDASAWGDAWPGEEIDGGSEPQSEPVAAEPGKFDPKTCHAVLGPVSSTGGAHAKTLKMSGTAAAWTTCARQSIRQRPASAIHAAVALRFDGHRRYHGARCVGCTPALAHCIAVKTGPTVSVHYKTGRLHPVYRVPVTFACR